MKQCKHIWKMINTRFGFIAYEKCYHCNGLRTYFSMEDNTHLGDKYREGLHFWTRVETAQSFRFDLQCTQCQYIEKFQELMGLMYCPGCEIDCEIDNIQKKYEKERIMVLIAFGFLSEAGTEAIQADKLDILTNYFNQNRDTSRSSIKILPFQLIKNLSICKGEFLHDVGLLSQESQVDKEKKSLF